MVDAVQSLWNWKFVYFCFCFSKVITIRKIVTNSQPTSKTIPSRRNCRFILFPLQSFPSHLTAEEEQNDIKSLHLTFWWSCCHNFLYSKQSFCEKIPSFVARSLVSSVQKLNSTSGKLSIAHQFDWRTDESNGNYVVVIGFGDSVWLTRDFKNTR